MARSPRLLGRDSAPAGRRWAWPWLALFLVGATLLPSAAAQSPPPVSPDDAPASDAERVSPGERPTVGELIESGAITPSAEAEALAEFVGRSGDDWTSPQRLTSSLQVLLLLTVLSLAPAVLLMTTSFVRIVVVLGLLRQAMGTQQLPPSQVITSLAMFMTLLVMTPVWKQVYDEAIEPYTRPDSQMTLEEAFEVGSKPIKAFMSRQIHAAGNGADVMMFYSHLPDNPEPPEHYDDVPLQVLLPAYMVSELKVAFLIGFQVYLPFLILDIVISSVTISMGMLMLPPVIVSLPFKLMLFVLVDGWRLVVGMLLDSFGPYT